MANEPDETPVAVTGTGLTTPGAKNLAGFQKSLLTGKSEIQRLNICYAGEPMPDIRYFNPRKRQNRRTCVRQEGRRHRYLLRKWQSLMLNQTLSGLTN